MSWLDIGVLVVLVASTAWGIWRGMVHEVLSLGGWILAFFAANLLCDSLAEQLPTSMRPEFRTMAAWLAVFIGLLVISTLVTVMLGKAIKMVGLVKLDRWLGALFGMARGLLILLAFALVAGLTPLPRSTFWTSSVTGRPLAETVLQLKPWLPSGLAQRLRYH
jgi:membrane protein required for colicin V production